MELLILVVLVLLNGVFAMSELAIVSSKSPRLKVRADRGNKGARAALKLMEDPSRMLSTVQIGITLIGIVAGAYGATAIADDLAPVIAARAPEFSEFADDMAFGVVIVATTYLSLSVNYCPSAWRCWRPKGSPLSLRGPWRDLRISHLRSFGS